MKALARTRTVNEMIVNTGGIILAASIATSLVSTASSSLTADGITTSVITVQLKYANGDNATSGGDTVVIATSVGAMSSTVDNSDGTYTATFTSPTLVGTATITAALNALGNITDNTTITLVPGAASLTTSTVSASPTSILNDGITTALITVSLIDANGNALTASGGTVAISTDVGTLTGTVTDNNDGTYNETLTSTVAEQNATVSATLDASNIIDTAVVAFSVLTLNANVLNMNFDNLVVGSIAEDQSGNDINLFDFGADNTYITDNTDSGIPSYIANEEFLMVDIFQGAQAPVGGNKTFINNVIEGETLWLKVPFYLPTGWNPDNDSFFTKFLRLPYSDVVGENPKHDIQMTNEAAPNGFRLASEAFGNPPNIQTFGPALATLEAGWHSIEIQVVAHSVIANGLIRIWIDDVLELDMLPGNGGTGALDAELTSPTLNSPTSVLDELLLFSFWNGGSGISKRFFINAPDDNAPFLVGEVVNLSPSGQQATVWDPGETPWEDSSTRLPVIAPGQFIDLLGVGATNLKEGRQLLNDLALGTETITRTVSPFESVTVVQAWPTQDQQMYIAKIVATKDTPPNTDSGGNAFIGAAV